MSVSLKLATLKPYVVDVICPHCQELCENPKDGSLMWMVEEMEVGTVVTCSACGDDFELPSQVEAAKL